MEISLLICQIDLEYLPVGRKLFDKNLCTLGMNFTFNKLDEVIKQIDLVKKFKDDPSVIGVNDYNTDIQRVFFLDEVHRSYNPKGSFLANLEQSDRNSIKIGLTGTPLLGEEYSSKSLFGGYIHK